MPEIHDHPDPAQRWLHRRIQAYVLTGGLIAYPIAVAAMESAVLADVAWPVMTIMGSIVALYHGASAWESLAISRSGN